MRAAVRDAMLRLAVLALVAHFALASAEVLPERGTADPRMRVATYSPNEVYRLYAYVGYQIDLEFDAGETFVGLGAGDIDGITFVAEGNHLFVKPRVAMVGTNLTVLTTRHQYQFDYIARARRPDPRLDEVIYAVRFEYPKVKTVADERARAEHMLDHASESRPRNIDYWFCGHPSVKPIAASDDGVHTRLSFAAKAEQPAIFVRNDDGTESLLNFSMDAGDVIIHRVARRFIVRRGRLTGCIVNEAFTGGSARIDTNTISEDVERATREVPP